MAERDNQNIGVKTSLTNPKGPYSLTYGSPAGGVVTGTGADWFGPLNPMAPVAPEDVKGRILDFPSGYNLNVRPRSYEAITFPMLRAFADSYDLLRILIETRKDQMARLKWNLVPRDKKMLQRGAVIPGDIEARISEIQQFFLMPDKEHFWDEWLRLLLEDLFVIDAPTLYRRKTIGGDLYALQPLDGGTIKRVIDDFGNTPEPPTPAYQQVLKGYPAVDYTTDELIYRPRVRRTHKIYGYSPVEQIVMTINIGMRRQTWQLQSFTEGNIPEALIGTPATWTPDQVRQFQDWFDSMLQGNTGERRRARFVPGDVAKGYIPTKPTELFGAAEEWLVRVMCYAFNVSPQPFVNMMNRATAETAQETAVAEGLAPIQNWVKGLMDLILIKDFNSPDLEFRWLEEEELDPNIKSQIIDREQAAGRLTFNEARKEQGLDPFDHPDADRPMFKTATGYVPIFLTPEEQAAKDAAAEAMAAALGKEPEDGEEEGDDAGGPPAPGEGDDASGDTSSGEEDPAEDEEAEKFAKGDFDESKVERDERGRFASSGGGGDVGASAEAEAGGSDPSGHGSEGATASVKDYSYTDGHNSRYVEEDKTKGREPATADNWQSTANDGYDDAKVRGYSGKDVNQQHTREIASTNRHHDKYLSDRQPKSTSMEREQKRHEEFARNSTLAAQGAAARGNYAFARRSTEAANWSNKLAERYGEKARALKEVGKSDVPEVAEKSDRPFVHTDCCGHKLAKVGTASGSEPYPHPLRPYVAKIEKRLALQLQAMLIRAGRKAAKQVKAKLDAMTKADYPDDLDIDAILESLNLDVFALSQEELEDALEDVMADGGRIALSQLGIAAADEKIVERVNQRALIWAKERAADLVNLGDDGDPLLLEATRSMLRSTIAAGIENNLSTKAIGELIEENYAFSEDRAQLIAATEITSANSMGALASYEEAQAEGVTVKKSWLILEDACDICQENADAGAIDLDEEFPSGDMAPGAHPNCRCVLVPEVEDSDGNTTQGDGEEAED